MFDLFKSYLYVQCILTNEWNADSNRRPCTDLFGRCRIVDELNDWFFVVQFDRHLVVFIVHFWKTVPIFTWNVPLLEFKNSERPI